MSNITKLVFASPDHEFNERVKPIVVEVKSGLSDSDVTGIITAFIDQFMDGDYPTTVLAVQVSESTVYVTVPEIPFSQWFAFADRLRTYLRSESKAFSEFSVPILSRKEARAEFARRILSSYPFSTN